MTDGVRLLWLTSIYGPNNTNPRKDFWLELLDLFGLTFPNWCVGEDFNVIKRISNKLGSSRLTSSMRDFDGFIRECELIDPPLRNVSFTWSNIQDSPVCKRLDKILYSNKWEQSFPQSLQEVLPQLTSNHCSIVLDTNPFKWGPTPFRFENVWLFHPRFPSFSYKDKALWLNGFTIVVFQECWDIKEDLVRVFSKFHICGVINHSTNATIIALEPIKSQTKKISNFRLTTYLYKIIVKVLSRHLRGVFHETIHVTQGAFVQARQILHAVLITMVQLNFILKKWGRVTKVAKETLKLVDLTRAKLWVEMLPNVVLPALLEVEDGEWSYTVAVSVAGEDEDVDAVTSEVNRSRNEWVRVGGCVSQSSKVAEGLRGSVKDIECYRKRRLPRARYRQSRTCLADKGETGGGWSRSGQAEAIFIGPEHESSFKAQQVRAQSGMRHRGLQDGPDEPQDH